MSELIITMRDIRASGSCSKGARAFFKFHGLDWDEFLKRGISADRLLLTGDALVKPVVEVARGRK